MILIYLSWGCVLCMFVVMLYCIHTMPIYARSPMERETQNMQLLRLSLICNLLAIVSSALLVAHFTVEPGTSTIPLNNTRHVSYTTVSSTPTSS